MPCAVSNEFVLLNYIMMKKENSDLGFKLVVIFMYGSICIFEWYGAELY